MHIIITLPHWTHAISILPIPLRIFSMTANINFNLACTPIVSRLRPHLFHRRRFVPKIHFMINRLVFPQSMGSTPYTASQVPAAVKSISNQSYFLHICRKRTHAPFDCSNLLLCTWPMQYFTGRINAMLHVFVYVHVHCSYHSTSPGSFFLLISSPPPISLHPSPKAYFPVPLSSESHPKRA
jgi:hypothetical protein